MRVDPSGHGPLHEQRAATKASPVRQALEVPQACGDALGLRQHRGRQGGPRLRERDRMGAFWLIGSGRRRVDTARRLFEDHRPGDRMTEIHASRASVAGRSPSIRIRQGACQPASSGPGFVQVPVTSMRPIGVVQVGCGPHAGVTAANCSDPLQSAAALDLVTRRFRSPSSAAMTSAEAQPPRTRRLSLRFDHDGEGRDGPEGDAVP